MTPPYKGAGERNDKLQFEHNRMRRDKRVFALGFFDGVHRGHQALLDRCVEMARALDCGTGAITFDAHPKSLFSADVPPLINSTGDRKRLLGRFGIEHIHTYPVTWQVMSMPWQDFLEELLKYGAAGFVCGNDFRFGARGEGSGETLLAFCRERGLPCVIVPEQTADGLRISSTHIRRLIEAGDMEAAVRFLGHPHLLTGTVVPGKQLGRTLGIPTANLRLPEGLAVPKFGVYACLAEIDGVKYPAVTNVGTRPTVSGQGITVEPWILDYSGDLYGRELTLEFHKFLRPEEKFPDLPALQAAIHQNARQTREFFEET